jgi:hypothetical protein
MQYFIKIEVDAARKAKSQAGFFFIRPRMLPELLDALLPLCAPTFIMFIPS